MSRLRTLGLALLALLGAAGAAAQQAAPNAGATPLDRLSPAARAAVEHLADSARLAGLPWEAVTAKAAEGALKGADEGRIVAVLRTLVGELAAARDALGPAATASEIVAGASALHAGVPAAEVRRLARDREARGRGRPLATALVVLADLVRRQVPPATATTAVGALVRKGAADADFAVLRNGVERAIRAGEAPHEATMAGMRVLLERP